MTRSVTLSGATFYVAQSKGLINYLLIYGISPRACGLVEMTFILMIKGRKSELNTLTFEHIMRKIAGKDEVFFREGVSLMSELNTLTFGHINRNREKNKVFSAKDLVLLIKVVL